MTICNRYPRELLHYDNHLKRKCFRRLKDNVWESKTKWQLLKKAEWTYHYKVLMSCFLPWLTFTKRKIRRRNEMHCALIHCSRKIKRKAFSILKHNVQQEWLLVKNLRNSIELKIMRKTWNYWEKYVRKNLRAKEVEALTIKARELHLIKSYLGLWLVNYNEKVSDQKMYENAATYHNQGIKRKTIKLWKDYILYRKKKKELGSYSSKRFQMKLKGKAFNRLTSYTKQKKLYRKHIQNITLFYENYLLKNVLESLSNKYEDLMELRNKDKNSLATKMCDRKLCDKYFKKLKMWIDQENARVSASEKFISVSATLKIQFCLDVWRKSLQERLFGKSMEVKAVKWRSFQIKKIYLSTLMILLEKRKEETKRIEDFVTDCNFKKLRNVFQLWLRFIYGKRLKRSRNEEAQSYYENRLVQKLFLKFKYFVAYKIRKNNVVIYYEGRLLSKAFATLKHFSEMKQFYRFQIANFRDRLRRQLMLHAFSIFKHKNKITKTKLWKASIMSEYKIKKKVLQQWKKHYENKRRTNVIWNENKSTLQNIVLQQIILTWSKNTQSKIALRQKLKVVKTDQDKRLLKRFFGKWLNIREKIRLLRQNTWIFSNLQSEMISQCYIKKLIFLWQERRNIRKKEIMAVVMEKGIILRRFFKQWMAYVNWKMEKLKECSVRVGFSVNETDHIQKNCYYYNNTKIGRKQPMIPAYLRELTLSMNEESFSS